MVLPFKEGMDGMTGWSDVARGTCGEKCGNSEPGGVVLKSAYSEIM